MFIPVKADTVLEPPRISIEVTIMFVRNPNTVKTMCAAVPHRARTISKNVCAVGARRFTSTASTAKRRIWIVAPLAYQNGPGDMAGQYRYCSKNLRYKLTAYTVFVGDIRRLQKSGCPCPLRNEHRSRQGSSDSTTGRVKEFLPVSWLACDCQMTQNKFITYR